MLGVPSSVWQVISGSIIFLVGLSYLRPQLYARLATALGFERFATTTQRKAFSSSSHSKEYLVGAALGPVFSACSPTYALIVAVIIPVSFIEGIIYLLIFLLGLSLALLAIAFGGNRLIAKFDWALSSSGWFKRVLGIILMAVGIVIVTGWDKDMLSYLVERGWYDRQIELENAIR